MEKVGMELSGLDITLRRISFIENRLNQVFGEDTTQRQEFQQILDKNMTTAPADNSSASIFGEAGNPLNPFDSSPEAMDSLITKYSNKYNLDDSLVKAVIKAESGFNPGAKSPVGALGLMQLMPSTAKAMGVQNPYDPEQNIEGGAKYLKGLLDRFGGDKEKAIAAYNAGPGAVKKYDGVPPYKETQNYVKKVLNYQKNYS